MRKYTVLQQAVGLLLGAGVLALGMIVGGAVRSPGAQAACVALPTDKGQATFTVTIPTAGSYRVWSRIFAPSASANGYFMQIDQSSCNVIVGHGSGIPAGQFTWVDWLSGNQGTKFDVTLTAGAHTVIAAGLDSGVGLDEIMFVTDKNCVPTGAGTECASSTSATATPVGQPVATPVTVNGDQTTAPVSGVVDLTTPTKAGVASVEYIVDGKKLTGTVLDTTKLSDGTHKVEVVSTATDGKVTTTSRTIDVQNGWQYKLVAGMKAQWGWVVGGLLLLLGLGGAGFVAWRTHFKLGSAMKLGSTPTSVPPVAPSLEDAQPKRSE